MKSIGKIKIAFIVGSLFALAGSSALAGPPFTAVEGYGGGAFNPFAWTEGQNAEPDSKPLISKPQFGAWYVKLGDVDVDWTAIGVGFTVAQRLELSYGYEVVAPTGKNLNKNNFGAKVNLLPENTGGPAVPAISAGALYKTISDVGDGLDDGDFDYYLVATKLITQTPIPVLLSGGALSTAARTTGVFGFDGDRDIVGFGNIAVLPIPELAVGVEYKQGADFGAFKNADYWDAHLIWFANKNLSLIGAYVNAGDHKKTSEVGLGDGFVLSAQYAF